MVSLIKRGMKGLGTCLLLIVGNSYLSLSLLILLELTISVYRGISLFVADLSVYRGIREQSRAYY